MGLSAAPPAHAPGPVPSPSMNGTIGLSGTRSVPEASTEIALA
jgi:hypothetical protein